jgi:5-methylcytosine-specific restriction endonuclease McrA
MAGDSPLHTRAWRNLRLAVLDRDLWLCQIKGDGCTHHATTVDHIVARADGGPMWDPGNLRGACRRCNYSVNARRTNTIRASKTAEQTAEYVSRF